MNAWTTFHVYLHRTTDEMNRFLLDEVRPIIDGLVAEGEITSWHFLRYWTGGPHLRIRLRDASPAVVDDVERRLVVAAARPAALVDLHPEDFYLAFRQADTDWFADGTVLRAPYVPETTRYGGAAALAVCEEFFETSSRLALDIIAAIERPQTLTMVGIDFMLLALESLHEADFDAVLSARGYFTGWDFSPESVTDAGAARRTAELTYWARPDVWDGRRASVRSAATAPDTTHAVWSAALRETVARLRFIDEDTGLENDITRIVWSLVHMMDNRLGLQVVEERVCAWLVSLTFPRTSERAEFHNEALTSPDRSYLEQSKYRLTEMRDGQRPRPLTPANVRPGYLAPLSLGADVLPTTTLVDALARRASGYGDYGGTMALGRLGSLLELSAGVSSGGNSDPAEAPSRPYPSASASYAVEVFVLARRVTDLAPGAYAFDAEAGGLRRWDARPGDDSLDLISPVFGDPSAGAPIAADTVPAVLVLAVDLARLRQRYGLRALRLALLEAGHIAQNIGLAAAALDMKSVHLQAFADDELNVRLHLDGLERFALALLPVGERR